MLTGSSAVNLNVRYEFGLLIEGDLFYYFKVLALVRGDIAYTLLCIAFFIGIS